MSTLLLRLAAPLQAWGVDSKFETRRTGREPSKSGVIGMIASAMGKRRDEPPEELNTIRFGIRVDREGTMLRDFHMVQEKLDKPYLTHRYYMQDAVYLVALEAEDELLHRVETALKNPVYPLYLGRRSCPPDFPLVLGMRDKDMLTALYEEACIAEDNKSGDMRIITDTLPGETSSAVVRDVAESYNPEYRRFGWRSVKLRQPAKCGRIEHDAMSELE